MVKKPKLTAKQAKIVAAKAEGKTQNDIGRVVFPNATPESAAVLVSRELKKVNVQEALQVALERHDITLDRALKPIGEALEAQKVVIIGKGDDAFADVTPDHSTRLQASDRALKLMGVTGNQEGGNTFNNYGTVINEQRDKYAD